jgi:hypothetical protein
MDVSLHLKKIASNDLASARSLTCPLCKEGAELPERVNTLLELTGLDSMARKPPRISAKELTADYVSSLYPFVERLIERIDKLDQEAAGADTTGHRREVCAAIWAAIVAALDASSLSDEDRDRFLPLVLDHLMPYWQSHCGAPLEAAEWLKARSIHYLQNRDRSNQITTAATIVDALLSALEVAESARPAHGRELTSLLAHRIISDVGHFSHLKSRHSFE